MTCVQISGSSVPQTSMHGPRRSGPFNTLAECNQACREGACCEGTTCTVKPQCQCQGTGKTFRGVGTTCSPNPCGPCFGKCQSGSSTPDSLLVTVSNWQSQYTFRDYEINGQYVVPRLNSECFFYSLTSRPRVGQCPDLPGVEYLSDYDLVITIVPNGGQISMKGCLANQPGCDCFAFRAPLSGANSLTYCSRPISQSGTAQALVFGNSLGSFNWSIAEYQNPLP